jgi:hypothetical protein
MSQARGALLSVLLAALTVLTGCGPSLPELTSQLIGGDLQASRVLEVDGFEADIVLCEQPRLAAAWDAATPEERRAFLDAAIELVSQGYDPTTPSPSQADEATPSDQDGATEGDSGMDHAGHGDHGAGAGLTEPPEIPSDPAALADVWRTTLAGRAFEECAGIEARRDSHH